MANTTHFLGAGYPPCLFLHVKKIQDVTPVCQAIYGMKELDNPAISRWRQVLSKVFKWLLNYPHNNERNACVMHSLHWVEITNQRRLGFLWPPRK